MTSLSDQQRALLLALTEQSPMPTTILYDVRVRYCGEHPDRTYKIGEPAGAVLRRLRKRGLVRSERGRNCMDWWITDEGLAAIGWAR